MEMLILGTINWICATNAKQLAFETDDNKTKAWIAVRPCP
jgi:hypothetical protein